MELSDKMQLLADILELEVSDIDPQTKLDDLEEWDSLAAISYIVMMEDEFGVVANPEDIRAFTTIEDILNSMKK